MGPTINSKLIKKYLERHAEKESRFSIQKFEEQFGSLAIFSNVLVVPIFDEQSDCLNSSIQEHNDKRHAHNPSSQCARTDIR